MSSKENQIAAAGQRRENLLKALQNHAININSGGNPMAVIYTAPSYIRNNDVEHEYRPGSDMMYLTAFPEPSSILVLRPSASDGEKAILFVRPKDPERELWDGFRHGPQGATETFNIDAAFDIAEFPKKLGELMKGHTSLWAKWGEFPNQDAQLLACYHQTRLRTRKSGIYPSVLGELSEVLHEQRQIKDEVEVAAMRQAGLISGNAFANVMAATKPGLNEADIAAHMEYQFKRGGAQRSGYGAIVAGGSNACVLHYVSNNQPLKDGDLLLVDAGGEVDMYTADITRTWPVNGKFSPAQKDLYEIVLAAQEASIAATVPGKSIKVVHEASRSVLAQGLIDLGVLKCSLAEALGEEGDEPAKIPLHKYFMHGTSHWIGSDVHDVGRYFDGSVPRLFKPGMAITVEPGLYIPTNDESVSADLRGIGIRIEDDILVTASGNEVLTKTAPKTVAEVEAAVGSNPLDA